MFGYYDVFCIEDSTERTQISRRLLSLHQLLLDVLWNQTEVALIKSYARPRVPSKLTGGRTGIYQLTQKCSKGSLPGPLFPIVPDNKIKLTAANYR